ncbi:MAG TPA: sugar transferase [Candidatus Paceibacterota bacterium]|nr:sugar transferase [Candidatus Paceibacterota bacterium]HMP19177.1 sugar transferase [Candidatus Paceibacterota bacterium]HMP85292.1 sugar transferase [Candidatus Paceibacterota bacterium]
MSIFNKKESIILVVGDFIILFVSLWIALSIRYFSFPNIETVQTHLYPFFIISLFWIFIFYVAGLYEKHTIIFKKNLPNTLFNTQIINSLVAILFFYLFPNFLITPKTILFIYIIISFAIIFLWRLNFFKIWNSKNKQNAVFISDLPEDVFLKEELINNNSYGINLVYTFDSKDLKEKIKNDSKFSENLLKLLNEDKIDIFIANLQNPDLIEFFPKMYEFIFKNVKFIDKNKIYETIFGQIYPSSLDYNWFLENISIKNNLKYDYLKRYFDFTASIIIGILSLFLYPIIYLLIKMEDGGTIFYFDERVGKNNKKIKLIKFRTMKYDDSGQKVVTKVGNFLRKTRLDEIPQIINVIRGDMSLIGPRPEQLELVNIYKNEIDFYDIRHIIRPGLSGWAQINQDNHPHHSVDISATFEKLSYDLFYLKNRSIVLDLKIALKTVKIIFLRKGK